MSEQKILYLSRADVEAVGVTMAEIIDALEIAFHEHGLGHVEMPPKPGVHSRPEAFIHAMPAYIPALHAIGVKWLSAYPANQERGLPYITGLLVLNDDETGLPLAVMDCTWITGMRTGAATRARGEVPGETGFRARGHPGLRRTGAHESGGAQNPIPCQTRDRIRRQAGERDTLRPGDEGTLWPRCHGGRRTAARRCPSAT